MCQPRTALLIAASGSVASTDRVHVDGIGAARAMLALCGAQHDNTIAISDLARGTQDLVGEHHEVAAVLVVVVLVEQASVPQLRASQ